MVADVGGMWTDIKIRLQKIYEIAKEKMTVCLVRVSKNLPLCHYVTL